MKSKKQQRSLNEAPRSPATARRGIKAELRRSLTWQDIKQKTMEKTT
jgi:hypothetical protein